MKKPIVLTKELLESEIKEVIKNEPTIKESWSEKLQSLYRELGSHNKSKKNIKKKNKSMSKEQDFNLLAAGLKIRHKENGLIYTISGIKPDVISVTSPEGINLYITPEELRNFKLD